MALAKDQRQTARRVRPSLRSGQSPRVGRIVDEYPVGYLTQLARPLTSRGDTSRSATATERARAFLRQAEERTSR